MAALSVSELNLYRTHRYSTYSTIGTSSMADSKIPSLGCVRLGLLQKPSSGYDLRQVFSSTSMKTYSDSPGAIDPALRRLEHRGLVRGTIEEGSGMRRRQVFHLTEKGLSELKKWITRPRGFGPGPAGNHAPVCFLRNSDWPGGRYRASKNARECSRSLHHPTT